jgi:hypothetical protein
VQFYVSPEVLAKIEAKLDQQMVARLAHQEHVCGEQEKIILNLEGQNATLRKLAALKKREKPKASLRVKLGKNPSRLRSAWLGIRESIWFAPLAFVETTAIPVIATIGSAVMVLFAMGVWVFSRPLILISGLCGYIQETDAK